MRRADLLALFDRERARFAREFPDLSSARLAVSQRRHPPGSPGTPRDLAWCIPGNRGVRVVQRALRLPRRNLVALMRHELAHLADPRASEREADALARRVTGQAIRYDAGGVQTVGKGGRRPRGLHR